MQIRVWMRSSSGSPLGPRHSQARTARQIQLSCVTVPDGHDHESGHCRYQTIIVEGGSTKSPNVPFLQRVLNTAQFNSRHKYTTLPIHPRAWRILRSGSRHASDSFLPPAASECAIFARTTRTPLLRCGLGKIETLVADSTHRAGMVSYRGFNGNIALMEGCQMHEMPSARRLYASRTRRVETTERPRRLDLQTRYSAKQNKFQQRNESQYHAEPSPQSTGKKLRVLWVAWAPYLGRRRRVPYNSSIQHCRSRSKKNPQHPATTRNLFCL